MRFFPREVRTFTVKTPQENSTNEPSAEKFVPNALEHLSDPHIMKELDSDTNPNEKFRTFTDDDYIYQF